MERDNKIELPCDGKEHTARARTLVQGIRQATYSRVYYKDMGFRLIKNDLQAARVKSEGAQM